MADQRFFSNAGPLSIPRILQISGARLVEESVRDDERMIGDVAPLDKAGAQDVSFLDNIKYVEMLSLHRQEHVLYALNTPPAHLPAC